MAVESLPLTLKMKKGLVLTDTSFAPVQVKCNRRHDLAGANDGVRVIKNEEICVLVLRHVFDKLHHYLCREWIVL